MDRRTGVIAVLALGVVLAGAWTLRERSGAPPASPEAKAPSPPPAAEAVEAVPEARTTTAERLGRAPVAVARGTTSGPAGEPPSEPGAPPFDGLLLHVVDASSRAHLDGVDVLRLVGWEERWDFPDGEPRGLFVRGERSPVSLALGGTGTKRLRVRAHGYAWRDVEVDPGDDEATVELTRAARLEVWVGDHDLELPVQVRLYPGGFEGHDPAYVARPALAGGPTVFESLRPDAYQLRVELGRWQDPPLLLARREIVLAPGESKTIELQPEHGLLDLRPAPLAGTLALPPGAAALAPVLRVERAHGPGLRPGDVQAIPLADMRASAGGRTYAWDAGEVTSGRVKLSVQLFQISAVVELLPSGDRDVRLVVPELATVALTVRDAATGELLPIGAVGWSRSDVDLAWQRWEPPYFAPGSDAERALTTTWASSGEPGRATFTAPVGRTRIEVHVADHDTPPRWVDLVPGTNELDLSFEALPSLLLGFTDGERLVPAPRGLTVRSADGSLEWRHEDDVGGRRLGVFEEPGVYVVSADADAELVFAPQEVRIRAGERTELDILVEPRR